MPKSEIIKIQDGENVIELKGLDKENFINQREKDLLELEKQLQKEKEAKEFKISAYKKLGLTDEEINAII